MRNAIMSELYKIRKNKILYVCTGLVLLSALWLIYKDKIASTPPDNPINWIQSAMIVTILFLSIASGFVITFLIQREYEDKTIINVLTAPTSRVVFILSKLVVWFMWYVFALLGSIIIYIIGGKIIYQSGFGFNEIKILIETIIKAMFLSFVASMPLLLVAVYQRRMFYPTMMCSLAFTGMEILAFMLPAKFASIIPWSAAVLIGFGADGEFLVRGIIVIAIAGIIGVIGACGMFRRQNL